MKTIANDSVVCFDVDNTLVLYEKPSHQNELDSFLIHSIDHDSMVKVWRHNSHIKLLKQQKARGRLVIVWSHGGYEWAKTVVEGLNLEDYVDLILTKPLMVVDDTQTIEGIVGSCIYLNKEKYLIH